MSQMIFMTVFSLLMTVGMLLVITWGMSNVGQHGEGYGKDHGEHSHSREICPEIPCLIDAAGEAPDVRKPGCVGGKPFGDRFIKQSWHRYPDAVGCFQSAAGGTVGERACFERTCSADCA